MTNHGRLSICILIITSSLNFSCEEQLNTTRTDAGINIIDRPIKGGERAGTEIGGEDLISDMLIDGDIAGSVETEMMMADFGENEGIEPDSGLSTAGEMAGMTIENIAGAEDLELAGCEAQANDRNCNGLDDDCDGQIDEGYISLLPVWSDCENFDSICDESGSQVAVETQCLDGILIEDQIIQECFRVTEGQVVREGIFSECRGFSSTCDETGVRSRSTIVCQEGSQVSIPIDEECTRNTDGLACREGTCSNGFCLSSISLITVSIENVGDNNSAARLEAVCVPTGASCLAEGNRSAHNNPSCTVNCPNNSVMSICCSNGDEGCGGTPEAPRDGLFINRLRLRGFELDECFVNAAQVTECMPRLNSQDGTARVNCDFTD